jgi:hypothetical protein
MQFAQDKVQWEASESHEVAYKWDNAGQGPPFKGICYMGADRRALILWDLRLSQQCSRWQTSGMSCCVQGLYSFNCWPWRWGHNMTIIQNAGSYVVRRQMTAISFFKCVFIIVCLIAGEWGSVWCLHYRHGSTSFWWNRRLWQWNSWRDGTQQHRITWMWCDVSSRMWSVAEWIQQYTNFVPESHSMLDTLHNDESDTLSLICRFSGFCCIVQIMVIFWVFTACITYSVGECSASFFIANESGLK